MIHYRIFFKDIFFPPSIDEYESETLKENSVTVSDQREMVTDEKARLFFKRQQSNGLLAHDKNK